MSLFSGMPCFLVNVLLDMKDEVTKLISIWLGLVSSKNDKQIHALFLSDTMVFWNI